MGMKAKALQERTTTQGRWFRVTIGEHGKAVRLRIKPFERKGKTLLHIVLERREGHWQDEWETIYPQYAGTTEATIEEQALPKWRTMTPRRLANSLERISVVEVTGKRYAIPTKQAERMADFLRAYALGDGIAQAKSRDIYESHHGPTPCDALARHLRPLFEG